ncbi:MAG TPA: hypothetical protein VFT00_05795 [Nocardioides sp.]|nr:hypothetical protein [Nocardioides sp.]
MDLSAFIFVALAVAWAVYLVPKAMKHHDDVVRSRSVDRFSHTMRVLARREPVGRDARLVVTPGRAASAPVVTAKGAEPTPVQARARRQAANSAARRRRRVLGAILVANLAVAGVAAFGVIDWVYVAIPVGLLVAWLVACRLMVRKEQAVWAPVRMPVATEADAPVAESAGVDLSFENADTSSMAAAIAPGPIDPNLWDPMPVTLPTYVTKPAATRRTVRTINLDDSGVWTSGNTEADSQIAREAHAADHAARTRQADDHRAVGS